MIYLSDIFFTETTSQKDVAKKVQEYISDPHNKIFLQYPEKELTEKQCQELDKYGFTYIKGKNALSNVRKKDISSRNRSKICVAISEDQLINLYKHTTDHEFAIHKANNPMLYKNNNKKYNILTRRHVIGLFAIIQFFVLFSKKQKEFLPINHEFFRTNNLAAVIPQAKRFMTDLGFIEIEEPKIRKIDNCSHILTKTSATKYKLNNTVDTDGPFLTGDKKYYVVVFNVPNGYDDVLVHIDALMDFENYNIPDDKIVSWFNIQPLEMKLLKKISKFTISMGEYRINSPVTVDNYVNDIKRLAKQNLDRFNMFTDYTVIGKILYASSLEFLRHLKPGIEKEDYPAMLFYLHYKYVKNNGYPLCETLSDKEKELIDKIVAEAIKEHEAQKLKKNTSKKKHRVHNSTFNAPSEYPKYKEYNKKLGLNMYGFKDKTIGSIRDVIHLGKLYHEHKHKEKNGKDYSPFACLSRYTRARITYDGFEYQEAFDIKCAHSLLSLGCFEKQGLHIPDYEISRFSDIVMNPDKDLYTEIIDYAQTVNKKRFNPQLLTRDNVKKALNAFLSSLKSIEQFNLIAERYKNPKLSVAYAAACEYMVNNFPYICAAVMYINKNDSFKEFANEVESEIMIPIILQEQKRGYHPIQTHDAFYLPKNEIDQRKQDLKQQYTTVVNNEILHRAKFINLNILERSVDDAHKHASVDKLKYYFKTYEYKFSEDTGNLTLECDKTIDYELPYIKELKAVLKHHHNWQRHVQEVRKDYIEEYIVSHQDAKAEINSEKDIEKIVHKLYPMKLPKKKRLSDVSKYMQKYYIEKYIKEWFREYPITKGSTKNERKTLRKHAKSYAFFKNETRNKSLTPQQFYNLLTRDYNTYCDYEKSLEKQRKNLRFITKAEILSKRDSLRQLLKQDFIHMY